MDATAAKTQINSLTNNLNLTSKSSNTTDTAVKSLTQTLQGLGTSIMSRVSPGLVSLANTLSGMRGMWAEYNAGIQNAVNQQNAQASTASTLAAIESMVSSATLANTIAEEAYEVALAEVNRLLGEKAGLARDLMDELGYAATEANAKAEEEYAAALAAANAELAKRKTILNGTSDALKTHTDGLKRAREQTDASKESANGMTSVLNKLKGSIKGIGEVTVASVAIAIASIAALIAELVLLCKQIKLTIAQAEELDAIDETSQKVMMSTDAYQQWCYILKMTGASASTLKTAMRGLNKAVNSNNSAFQQLGISQSQVANMDRSDLFALTIERLQQLSTAEEKAAVASELFGSRAYSDIMPLLNQTNADVEKLIQTYDALGIAVNSDYTSGAAKLQDSIDLLKYSFEALKNTLAVKLLPILQKIVEWITVAVTIVNYFLKAVLGIKSATSSLDATDTTSEVTSGWEEATDAANAYKRSIMGFDELNTLNDEDSGSSSSGVSIDTSDFDTSGIANLAVLSEDALNFLEKVKGAIDKITPALQAIVPIVTIIAGIAMAIAGFVTGNIPLGIAGIGVALAGLTIGISNHFGVIGELVSGLFTSIGEWFSTTFGSFGEFLSSAWNLILQIPIINHFAGIIQGIAGQLSGLFTTIGTSIALIVKKCWAIVTTIGQIVAAIGKAIYTYAIKPVIDFCVNFYKKYLAPIVNWVNKVAVSIGVKIGDKIGGLIKAAINGALSFVQNKINNFINLLNGVIDVVNKIPGVSISKITKLVLPRMATGGIVTRGTIAEIGENGKEAVLPLENNTEWMYKLANIINADRGSQDICVNVDGKNLFDMVVARNNQTVNRTGRSPLYV